jgi:hypothetical protein
LGERGGGERGGGEKSAAIQHGSGCQYIATADAIMEV